MIVLWLLAAHMVGDYVLQTRWQAARKIGPGVDAWSHRVRHVLAYSVPFIPIAVVCDGVSWRVADFLALLFLAHMLTDSHRFQSTLGDWIAWQGQFEERPTLRQRVAAAKLLPANPWGPLPILIDQSLHLVQLSVLGSLFLR